MYAIRSYYDLCFTASRPTTVAEVNAAVKAACEGSMKGIMAYNEAPLVSVDFNHNPHSSVFDATLTKVMQGSLVKVLSCVITSYSIHYTKLYEGNVVCWLPAAA